MTPNAPSICSYLSGFNDLQINSTAAECRRHVIATNCGQIAASRPLIGLHNPGAEGF